MCVCVCVCLVNSKVSGVVAVGCRLFPGDGDRGTGTRSQRGRVGGPRVQFPRGRLQSVQLPGAVAQTAAGRRRPDEHHGQRQRTVLGD